mmetsp:Transcript_13702/g.35235  ORF Transcript_13702/g.35235 Transcript_13702/m.35235 type:complete len:181 (-) Transcript_13702:393-935(-)|eukprot:CAMPEP_0115851350 /NCGR_PEP_ID=MMETSP0287-20121206/12437_1 /TAXON_ID=412157 /ORGANISM="Chrysochromulina rotalis, Strain UIO044" /LENGTH=180 /DNA_ID=CAMNT_0003305381 /DNA_START=47 /DNA_END=589 /DNA_ORIENTATION=+
MVHKDERFLQKIAKRQYLEVLKELSSGTDANVSWRGLLPLRTAVLVGDADMVAILCNAGGNPDQEPSIMEYPTGDDVPEDAPKQRVVLGKCARVLAQEMAADMANPLHREAVAMVKVMAEQDEAKKRVISLHGRLEAELSDQVQQARRSLLLSFVATVAVGLLYWYVLRPMESGHDDREL